MPKVNKVALTAMIGALALAGAAHAEIVDAQAGGFTVRQSLAIAAPAGRVWEALAHVGAWWDPAHTFSGDARNLAITLKPGGFWLESLPGDGAVRHMVVVYVQPGRTLRLEGALGPLQSFGVAGHLTWTLKEKDGATLVTETYDVGGHAPGGLDKIAGPVDGVMADQVARLKHYVETGKPQ
jgi:uncharacterized protein YndB with AHSA1/START domain